MSDDKRPTIQVAECPYGCGELHEVETGLSPLAPAIVACVRAPSTPMVLIGFGQLSTRTVRLARSWSSR